MASFMTLWRKDARDWRDRRRIAEEFHVAELRHHPYPRRVA
jgi:hypothetical protein